MTAGAAFHILVMISSITLTNQQLAKPVVAKLLELRSCEEYKDMAIGFKNIVITKSVENKYLASGDFTVHRVVEGPIKVAAIIYKCETRMENTCSFYAKAESEGCKQLEERKGALYTMFQRAHLNITECPLTKNDYTVVNYELKLSATVAAIAAEQSAYWKGVVKGTGNGDQVVLCAQGWAEVSFPEEKRQRGFFNKG